MKKQQRLQRRLKCCGQNQRNKILKDPNQVGDLAVVGGMKVRVGRTSPIR